MSPDHMPSNDKFLENLSEKLAIYEGCGNMLGIVPLTLAGYDGDAESWKKDSELRQMLTPWGKEIKSDSVMVLFGDPAKFEEQFDENGENYHVRMFVFEPSGDDGSGLGGGISTMCGNGIRGVCAWINDEFDPNLSEFSIATMSGLRKVVKKDGEYVVNMGDFVDSSKDLSGYTERSLASRKGEYLDAPIPENILKDLSELTSAKIWSIGLTGNRNSDGSIDGEPHIVIDIPKEEVGSLEGLRKLAVAAGPLITKNLGLFPKEINVNFVVIDKKEDGEKFVVWNATHERNLGSDANHSVTAACGTGSTVVGGFMLEKYLNDKTKSVLVKNTGGNLEISLENPTSNVLLMKGPANRVSL